MQEAKESSHMIVIPSRGPLAGRPWHPAGLMGTDEWYPVRSEGVCMANSVPRGSTVDLFTIQTFRDDPTFREESLAMLVSVWQEPLDCGSKLNGYL